MELAAKPPELGPLLMVSNHRLISSENNYEIIKAPEAAPLCVHEDPRSHWPSTQQLSKCTGVMQVGRFQILILSAQITYQLPDSLTNKV